MDLMGGQVVRAQYGDRDHYRPIVSGLGCSSEPLAVAQALLKLYPFTTLYIADLDALRGNGNHLAMVAKLRAQCPQLQLWLDAGITRKQDWAPWAELGVDCVVGTESQRDMSGSIGLMGMLGARAILSLDYHLRERKGLPALFEQPQHWPQRVIAMTLDRVGSRVGPDWGRLEQLRGQFDGTLLAAGGVRNAADLLRLKQMGVGGALVASALHDGNLSGQDMLAL